MIPTEPLTRAEEAAAFALLVNDPRKELKTAPEPLHWLCTSCWRPVKDPLVGCICGGRCAPDFMRLKGDG